MAHRPRRTSSRLWQGPSLRIVIEELFTGLTRAVEGAPALALGAAFLWGVLSILLSPCHLSSIPLIVGFVSGQADANPRRAFWLSTLFSAGILITIAVIGIVTAAAGRMLGNVGARVSYLLAAILFVIGLQLLGVIPLPSTGSGPVRMKSRGLLAALILGLVFGVALGPCTFAYLAPMLAVTFKLATSGWLYGSLLLLAYGIGHCGVIVIAGTSIDLVQRYLNWNESSRAVRVVKGACGVLVLGGGFYLIYASP